VSVPPSKEEKKKESVATPFQVKKEEGRKNE
jgi:hypothetical protein